MTLRTPVSPEAREGVAISGPGPQGKAFVRGTGTSKQGGHMEKWECQACGYIYDPSIGDPDHDLPPGTAFEELPDDWVCPQCGVGKDFFQKVG
jgi:rubredoxin